MTKRVVVIASEVAVGRGNPVVLLRASPELKEDVSSFQRFAAARVLKEDASSFQRAHPVRSRLLRCARNDKKGDEIASVG